MTDRELLELAAKAAGYELVATKLGYPLWIAGKGEWNPLTDDGDALRLQVKCHIEFEYHDDWFVAYTGFDRKVGGYAHSVRCEVGDDEMAAVRRATVLMAAEIGKTL